MSRAKLRTHATAEANRRDATLAEAAGLIRARKDDEAESVVRKLDSSIQGGVALERLFRAELERLVAEGDRDPSRTDAVYRRGLSWAMGNFPEVHTAVEREEYDQARAQRRAEYQSLLGREAGPDGPTA